MDLIVAEIEVSKKNKRKKSVNFGLQKMIILAYYTKWKRNIVDENDKTGGYLKDIEKNHVRQRVLSRYSRAYIRRLMIPLYDGMQKI